jgi:hypothetical protein
MQWNGLQLSFGCEDIAPFETPELVWSDGLHAPR